MREKVKLEIESGPLKGKTLDFDEAGILVCGVASDCHIRLPKDDRTVSRRHFVMGIQPPRVTVRDLGSHNGTKLNGKEDPQFALIYKEVIEVHVHIVGEDHARRVTDQSGRSLKIRGYRDADHGRYRGQPPHRQVTPHDAGDHPFTTRQ